jgi:uncharacterized membrane protein
MNTMVDLKIRSWVKSFTWRIIGVFILLPLTYVFTGNWESAGGVTLSFNVIRMLLYYVHERAHIMGSWRKKGQDFIYVTLILLILSYVLVIIVGLGFVH